MTRPPWAGRDGWRARPSVPDLRSVYELPPVRLPPWRCATPRGHWGECSPFDNFSGKVPQLALQIVGELEGSAAAGPICGESGEDPRVPPIDPDELGAVTAECRFALERREWALYVSLAAGYPEVQAMAERWEDCTLCQGERPGAPPAPWMADREICPLHRLEIWLIYGTEMPEPVSVDTGAGAEAEIIGRQQLPLW